MKSSVQKKHSNSSSRETHNVSSRNHQTSSSFERVESARYTRKHGADVSVAYSAKALVCLIGKKMKRHGKLFVRDLLLSRHFATFCKTLVVVGVCAFVVHGSYGYINKTFANEVIVSQGEIIDRVGKLVELPKDAPYEIVRVQDEEELRAQNDFYHDVKEGDYIVMYKHLAVIYDFRKDVIVALKRTK